MHYSYTCIHSYINLHTYTHYTPTCSYAGIDSPISWTCILIYIYIDTCTKHLHGTHEYPLHMCSHSPAISLVLGMSPESPVPQPKAITLNSSICGHRCVHGCCFFMYSQPSTVRHAHVSEKQLLLFVYFPINKPSVHQTL